MSLEGEDQQTRLLHDDPDNLVGNAATVVTDFMRKTSIASQD